MADGKKVLVPACYNKYAVLDIGANSLDGEWIVEGHDVDRDIEVGGGPGPSSLKVSIERAIAETIRMLREHPPMRLHLAY